VDVNSLYYLFDTIRFLLYAYATRITPLKLHFVVLREQRDNLYESLNAQSELHSGRSGIYSSLAT